MTKKKLTWDQKDDRRRARDWAKHMLSAVDSAKSAWADAEQWHRFEVGAFRHDPELVLEAQDRARRSREVSDKYVGLAVTNARHAFRLAARSLEVSE